MAGFSFKPGRRAFELTNAFWMAKAAELAYGKSREIRKVVKRWGFPRFKFFSKGTTQAFVAGNTDMILVVFRGTEPTKIKDWMTDAKIRQVRGFGGKVHRGFDGALGKVWGGRKGIVRTVKEFLDNDQTLWVAGHSLGAALAALAVAASGKEGLVINGLYTFGMPRVGNKAFARRFDKRFRRRTFRFVNNNDLVTRVPPRLLHYKHVGSVKYLDHDGRLRGGIGRWRKFLDRVRGRMDDFLKPGTDGFKDHSMRRYVKAIKSNL